MGGEPYSYTVPYEPDIQTVLDKLRQSVFKSGDFNGAELKPTSPEEALEMATEEGTRSILDITRVSEVPDFCCAAPLTSEELDYYFGTDKPTKEMVRTSDEFWDGIGRGTARYVILHDEAGPKEVFFAGYSFD